MSWRRAAAQVVLGDRNTLTLSEGSAYAKPNLSHSQRQEQVPLQPVCVWMNG